MNKERRYILMLDEDADDRELTASFFASQGYDVGLEFVTGGDELMAFLERRLSADEKLPGVVLVSRYVRGQDSEEIVRDIKQHALLKHLPVVVLSESAMQADIAASYRVGASTYIVKPSSFALTAKKIAAFVSYWFEVAELPEEQMSKSIKVARTQQGL